ncbi:MAG: formate dehydrogenase [Desulfobacteraceae bacterium]|nr:MAG: formate dehydrogenase [Desulfobacteraceae bacterium]
MGIQRSLNIENEDILTGIQGFLTAILASQDIDAMLVPKRTSAGHSIMPVLISHPRELNGVDPISPQFPLNAARQVSKLTKKPSGKKIAVLLRPCEIRALIELVKLKQGDLSSLLLISIDCPGAYSNKEWASQCATQDMPDAAEFIEHRLSGRDLPIAKACDACEWPVAALADIQIGFFGMDYRKQLLVLFQTAKGEMLADEMALESVQVPEHRSRQLNEYISNRRSAKAQMFENVRKKTNSLTNLEVYFEACVNCYNCRVACPVCYCRECVFNTDVFDHDSYQYLVWARRNGSIKLPCDTLFFHLTRLVHMSLSCVGCGQCTNACPNDIPVSDLFRMVGEDTQAAFDYEAGFDPDQALPLSEFKENEFLDVAGV